MSAIETLKFCPACDYDLRVHVAGTPCPECGEVPPEGELEVRGWADWDGSFNLGLMIFVPHFILVVGQSDWGVVLGVAGLLLGSLWLMRAYPPRCHQVRFGPTGFKFRYVGEPAWREEHWLGTSDNVLTKRRLGVTSLFVVHTDPGSPGELLPAKRTKLKLNLTATDDRLAMIRQRVGDWISESASAKFTPDLPRHPRDPEVVVIPVYRPHAVSAMHWMYTQAGVIAAVGVIGFMAVLNGSSVLRGIFLCVIVYLLLSYGWWRGFGRISRDFVKEFRFGPGGHQFATRGDPIRLKPWRKSDYLDWRSPRPASMPGVVRARIASGSRLWLQEFHPLVMSGLHARVLSARIVAWKRG